MQSLSLKTQSLGREYHFFEQVDSTNSWLRVHYAALPHGAVAAAACQTGGKGRMGRAWQDIAGQSLSFSVLLKKMPQQTLLLLPILAALAVRRGIFRLTAVQADLKWPNDVLINGKKICGILCEAFPEEDALTVVCGIGVNMLQPADYFDKAGLPHGGSLLTTTEKSCQPEQLLPLILEELEKLLACQMSDGFAALRQEYLAACINIGREVRVQRQTGEYIGTAVDVDNEGRLFCRFAGSDSVEAVSSGEVSVRGIYGYGE